MIVLRYRGYYYDTETGLYYLQSRYYDPVVKRFINADSYSSTGQGFLGYNMFAYCGNNPSVSEDSYGNYYTNAMMADGGGRSCNKQTILKRAVVLYYVRKDGRDFSSQATYRFPFYESYKSITQIPFTSKSDFISCWKSLQSTDDVFIYAHGTSTSLEFPDGSLDDFSQVSTSNISGTIYLFSCHGNGISNDLARANSCRVVACQGFVSFSNYDGYSYPFSGTQWYNFFFGRKTNWYQTEANGSSQRLVGNCVIAVS